MCSCRWVSGDLRRPEVRSSDIKDISDILNHFFAMNDNVIWEDHSDLFNSDNPELLMISARVLGRLVRRIADRNEVLKERLKRILVSNSGNPAESRMAAILVEYFNTSAKRMY